MQHNISSPASARAGIQGEIETLLHTTLTALSPASAEGEQPAAAGRPRELQDVVLWMGVLVGILRHVKSQRAVWRLLAGGGLWSWPTCAICDQTVYDRLQVGLAPLQALFERIRVLLQEWLAEPVSRYEERVGRLAPFATHIYALDEMWADPVRRLLPCLRGLKKGDGLLLPGKIAALFDVRSQQWRAVEYIEHVTDNCKDHARSMLSYVEAGCLLLFDLGYFSFQWLDELTAAGIWWVSRLREKTSYEVIHVFYQQGETFDGLVWLGSGRAQAAHAVRLVEFRVGATCYRYLSNVTDPTQLSMREVARLYVRRWDIELAFLTLKEHLGLHLWWSSKPAVVLVQLWACLILAQVLQALRMEVAFRAEVDPFEVSLPLLIETLPQWSASGRDAVAECVRQGRRLGLIRPCSRTQVQAPQVALTLLVAAPASLVLKREPHYPSEQPNRVRRAKGQPTAKWQPPPYELLLQ